MFFKKTVLALGVCASLVSTHVAAVVCVDATGNALQIEEMLSSAARWVEEKSAFAAEYVQNEAISIYDNLQAEYRASAEIRATTTATSVTANAAAEERFLVSPSACQSLARAKASVNSLVNPCDDESKKKATQTLMNKIADCGRNGSGLNCGAAERRRKEVSNVIVDAIKDRDADTLSTVLDGAVNFGLGDQVLTKENESLNQASFDLLLGLETPKNIPRTAGGNLPRADDEQGQLMLANWAHDLMIDQVAGSALTKVRGLYNHIDGNKSQMARLKERVDYYNSEEFIKLITNTNDKSSLPPDWETMRPEARYAYLETLPTNQQIVSSEQVIRMMAEMESLSLQFDYMNLESSLTGNTLQALIAKAMK